VSSRGEQFFWEKIKRITRVNSGLDAFDIRYGIDQRKSGLKDVAA
jgi:hypothetical protein